MYNYTYPSDVPLDVVLGCNAENISLLNAEKCLFYRYDQLGWIKYIWAVGLLAAGQSSTMTVGACMSMSVWVPVCMCEYWVYCSLAHPQVKLVSNVKH